ncbi:hypothetical protein SH449x_004673 [Pirellulaceae bacterium SH449]
MIHAYHVIFGTYGFWLPNDPRGSWSDFVGAWELLRFGNATKGIERLELTPEQNEKRLAAKQALKLPAVRFNEEQTQAVATGFANAVRKSNFSIWRCSIFQSMFTW